MLLEFDKRIGVLFLCSCCMSFSSVLSVALHGTFVLFTLSHFTISYNFACDFLIIHQERRYISTLYLVTLAFFFDSFHSVSRLRMLDFTLFR